MIAETADSLGQQIQALAEALRALAASAQQPAEPQSSVEIARNSKGATWTVKVYDSDPVTASTTAQALYDDLAARYGTGAV